MTVNCHYDSEQVIMATDKDAVEMMDTSDIEVVDERVKQPNNKTSATGTKSKDPPLWEIGRASCRERV